MVQSDGKDVAILEHVDGDLECIQPIYKLCARCSCQTEMDPNCWCNAGVKKEQAMSIRNSILQVYENLVLAKVEYGVLTDTQHWYLVKRDHSGYFYISKCFNWGDTKPPLLAAIAYLVNSAVDSRNEFDVSPWKVDRPWSLWPPFGIRWRLGRCSNLEEDQLKEILASDLHLDDRPITTGNGSGYVVGGTLKGSRVAVKFAPRNSRRSKALVNEVGALLKLREHWGFFVPTLVEYGTTANGQVVFIATELIDGSPLGPGKATNEVASAALQALRAVHGCNLLHGDLKAQNIIVVQGTQPSVRLVDFSNAEWYSIAEWYKTAQDEEFQRLLSLLRYGS